MEDAENTTEFTYNKATFSRPVWGETPAGECNCALIRAALHRAGMKGATVHCAPLSRYRGWDTNRQGEYRLAHGGLPNYAFDGVLGAGRDFVVCPGAFAGNASTAAAISATFEQMGVIDPADPNKATKRGRKSSAEGEEGGESAEKAAAWQKHYARVSGALDTLGIETERYRECAAFPQNEKHAGDIAALVGMLSEQLPIAKELLKKLDGVELSWAPPRIDPAPGCIAKLLPGEAAAFREEQSGMIDDAEIDLLCSEACWVLKKVMPDGRRVIAEANVGLDTVRRALTMGDFLIVRAASTEAPKA